MSRGARASTALALLLVLGPTAHAGVTTGVRVIPSFTSGELDSGVQVDLAALPVTFFVRSDRVSLRATLPYLQMETEIPVFYIGGQWLRIPVGGDTIREEGPGDLVLNPSVLLHRGGLDRTSVWGGARIKVPTADEDKHLGTGETDYGPAFGVLQPVGDRLLVSGTAHYIVRGDPPEIDLRNTLVASLAGRVRVASLDGITLAVSHAGAARPEGDPSWGVSAFHDRLFRARGFSLHAGAFTDRSGAATGSGFALGFTYRDDPLPWGL